ncbi:large ribosomal subunit protein uL23m-like [Diadema antillarum]|uniref:large ribosomal subunit protein uL23m-like n=1 Tax=Diadema antillarum TaxID=105358 RepID=UPI003A8A6234
MSKSRYPLYFFGNPQRRVFFTDFCMKLIKNKKPMPPNMVTFECDLQMTKFDIKNYLQNIYKVPVARVNTRIVYVPFDRNHKNQRVKLREDYKLAYVTLAEGQTFEFPELFPDTEEKKNEEMAEELKDKEKKAAKLLSRRGGVPNWFSI